MKTTSHEDYVCDIQSQFLFHAGPDCMRKFRPLGLVVIALQHVQMILQLLCEVCGSDRDQFPGLPMTHMSQYVSLCVGVCMCIIGRNRGWGGGRACSFFIRLIFCYGSKIKL